MFKAVSLTAANTNETRSFVCLLSSRMQGQCPSALVSGSRSLSFICSCCADRSADTVDTVFPIDWLAARQLAKLCPCTTPHLVNFFLSCVLICSLEAQVMSCQSGRSTAVADLRLRQRLSRNWNQPHSDFQQLLECVQVTCTCKDAAC